MAVNILSQYLASLTEPLAHIESHILAKFIPVLTTLCMQGLKQGRCQDFSKGGGSHWVKQYRHGVFATEYCSLFA